MKPIKITFPLLSAVAMTLALSLIASCTLAEKDSDGDQWISLAKKSNRGIYVEKCGMCHRPGGMGTGLLQRRYEGDTALLENRTDLQAPFIETVVRNGFSTMFPISRAEVSDEQLQAIIQHLTDKPLNQ